MSGTLSIHGSFDTSTKAVVYRVSALGAVTVCMVAGGYVRNLTSWPMGACVASGVAHVGHLPTGHVHGDQRVAINVGVDCGFDRILDTGLGAGLLRARIRAGDQPERKGENQYQRYILAFHRFLQTFHMTVFRRPGGHSTYCATTTAGSRVLHSTFLWLSGRFHQPIFRRALL